MTHPLARIALVGDRSANVRAHARIPMLIDALLQRDGIALDAYWIATPDAAAADLGGFDAIWVVPGSPYDSADGAVAAIRTARERRIPFLATCGGFQHALLEFARNVCGLSGVEHAESAPGAAEHLILQLECSLMGHEAPVMIVPGTLAAKISGPGRRTERYNCAYGLNPAYLERLSQAGLRFSGFDDSGQVRIAELPDHPFFIGTLFQPELAGDGTQPHPIIVALAAAATAHATATANAKVLASSAGLCGLVAGRFHSAGDLAGPATPAGPIMPSSTLPLPLPRPRPRPRAVRTRSSSCRWGLPATGKAHTITRQARFAAGPMAGKVGYSLSCHEAAPQLARLPEISS